MNKKQIIDKIVNDLPMSDMLGKMTKEEWYGWFEECWDKAINYTHCCTQLLCLNTHETWDITEGKIYDKEGENQREYIITDDKGKRAKYFKRHFEEVQN